MESNNQNKQSFQEQLQQSYRSQQHHLQQRVRRRMLSIRMTDAQLTELRKQILAFDIISRRLINAAIKQENPFDPSYSRLIQNNHLAHSTNPSSSRLMQNNHLANPTDPSSSRLMQNNLSVMKKVANSTSSKEAPKRRWKPCPTQLEILEKYFVQYNGKLNKQNKKEIVEELAKHGPAYHDKVHNWFINKKSREKRKQVVKDMSDNSSSEGMVGVEASNISENVDREPTTFVSNSSSSIENAKQEKNLEGFDEVDMVQEQTTLVSEEGIKGLESSNISEKLAQEPNLHGHENAELTTFGGSNEIDNFQFSPILEDKDFDLSTFRTILDGFDGDADFPDISFSDFDTK